MNSPESFHFSLKHDLVITFLRKNNLLNYFHVESCPNEQLTTKSLRSRIISKRVKTFSDQLIM